MNIHKTVHFDLDLNQLCVTYSSLEYDRSQIDHLVYRRAYNRVSDQEMSSVYIALDIYKLYEMIVNKDSFRNTCFQAKKWVNLLT